MLAAVSISAARLLTASARPEPVGWIHLAQIVEQQSVGHLLSEGSAGQVIHLALTVSSESERTYLLLSVCKRHIYIAIII